MAEQRHAIDAAVEAELAVILKAAKRVKRGCAKRIGWRAGLCRWASWRARGVAAGDERRARIVVLVQIADEVEAHGVRGLPRRRSAQRDDVRAAEIVAAEHILGEALAAACGCGDAHA